MGIRHWLRKKRAEQAEDGDDDRAPSGSIISAIFGREAPTLHALGEFDQTTYPGELQDLLRRREDVAEELREMDLTTRQARVDAIPRLQQMLRTYPHPLAYEVLIHAYVDGGRWDEARGAAFAARERRTQVARSPYSEIRAEIDRLKEWTPAEVDLLRQEREGNPAFVPVKPSAPAASSAPLAAAPPVAVPEPSAPVAVADAEPFRASGPMDSRVLDSEVLTDPVTDSRDAAESTDSFRAAAPADSFEAREPVDSFKAAESGRMTGPLDSGDEESDSGEPTGGALASGGGSAPRQGGKRGGKSSGRGGPRRRK